MMPSRIKSLLLLLIALGVTSSLRAPCRADEASAEPPVETSGEQSTEPSVTQLNRLITDGQWDESVSMARSLADQREIDEDLTLPLARLARGLQNQGDLKNAAEFYLRAVSAIDRPAAKQLTTQQVILVRLAASLVLAQTNRISESMSALLPTLDTESGANDAQRQMAVTIALRIGSTALGTGSNALAREAYAVAWKHADEKHASTAMLGDAWATAVQNTQPLVAAKKLAAFVDQFPDHADAPRASRACAECLKQADRAADATAMLSDLLERWPDSEPAAKIVGSHGGLAIDLVPAAVRRWLIRKAKADDLESLDAKTTMLGLMIAAQQNEVSAWSNLAKHLARIDESGQVTSDTLSKLSEEKKDADAERLAALMISPAETGHVTVSAREAACRWAGRTQRWSMLAIASEDESLDQLQKSRTIAVERLFAESLMQMGRVEDASRWWNYLVDQRSATDFPTLLRCAEAETAVGHDTRLAEQRIAAARNAVGNNRFSMTLVDMLDSALAIRRSKFGDARALLERVVRSNETDPSVRGRAQWLIGETFFLQHDFVEAIEAYRRVEGIDPGGMCVPTAILQSGKSFELLGRTREATVCYGFLLTHFPNTPLANRAQRRLAAITPGQRQSSDQSTPSDKSTPSGKSTPIGGGNSNTPSSQPTFRR